MRGPAFHTLRQETNFYFVRHGESESNRAGLIQGHSDTDLTDEGRRHALAAAGFFQGRGIDRICSSPLTRCRETAAIIAGESGAPEVEIMDELIELQTGHLSGKSIRQLAEEDPELYRKFRIHSWQAIPNAERIEAIQARGIAVWDALIAHARQGERTVVCVTHGGILQWIIKATFGVERQGWMPIFPAANCGIFLFSAVSTSLEHEGPGPVPANAGYFGAWELMNHVPYDTESRDDETISRK